MRPVEQSDLDLLRHERWGDQGHGVEHFWIMKSECTMCRAIALQRRERPGKVDSRAR